MLPRREAGQFAAKLLPGVDVISYYYVEGRWLSSTKLPEATETRVAMAAISGVMFVRNLPQISIGKVLFRPVRKIVTTTSLNDSVKASSAPEITAPRM